MAGRNRTAEEKWQILMEGLKSGASVAEVCRRHQIAESQYYVWFRQMEEAAKERLSGGGASRGEARAEREKEALRAKLARQQAIIAEVVTENLVLKKTLGA